MILGAVLAGGRSTRFGSDKALAVLDGETLLARAVDLLSGWCAHVVVAGREQAPAPCLPARYLPDWPAPGMGPLGGIAAALHLAQGEGYEAVLTIGVDTLGLPEDLPNLLAPAPACLADQPVVGLWPASASGALDAILTGAGKHSLRALAAAVSARSVQLSSLAANINTPEDLARWRGRAGENAHGP